MTELQLGLIGLGAAAVAGVFAYNKWQEYRHREVAKKVLARDHEDVLLAGRGPVSVMPEDEDDLPAYRADEPAVPEVHEAMEPKAPASAARFDQPSFRSVRERVEPGIREEPVFDDGRIEPALTEAAEGPVAAVFQEEEPVLDIPAEPPIAPPSPAPVATQNPIPAPGTRAAALQPEMGAAPEQLKAAETNAGVPAILVSPAIDYIASFDLVEEVHGDQILRSQREALSRVTKPINWAGYNERSREWERVVEEGHYRRLQVGLQLADRRGPLGEADLLTFQAAMQQLAEELMAVADMPDRDAALDAAVGLDHFCANVDIQIGLNLIAQGQTFPGTKIRALAEAAGMVLDTSGRFVRCDDDGYVLYTLCNQESVGFTPEAMKSLTTHGLVFLLDVPCVSHGDRVFAQMLDLARRMAETLRGVLVDDNRRPLTEAMLDPFRRQIGQYQSQLAAKGLPAGSPLTLRLFA